MALSSENHLFTNIFNAFRYTPQQLYDFPSSNGNQVVILPGANSFRICFLGYHMPVFRYPGILNIVIQFGYKLHLQDSHSSEKIFWALDWQFMHLSDRYEKSWGITETAGRLLHEEVLNPLLPFLAASRSDNTWQCGNMIPWLYTHSFSLAAQESSWFFTHTPPPKLLWSPL